MQTIRRHALALAIIAALLSTAASCPPKTAPTEQEAVDRLTQLAKRADQAVTIVLVARGLQDSEIAVFNSKQVAGFTLDKHQQYQRAFKTFFDVAEAQMKIAKDVSVAAAVRDDAIAALVKSGDALLAEFVDAPSPLLLAIVASLKASLAIISPGA